ncbi:hypothetical protein EBN03_06575 [Nocardia stercoris]|uniref:Choline/carnitine acyltransferase domain-containing protein n=1 Tax=Nocardia stercoris TaxID=2483361 RepID=A0A3M2L9K5_9NOCA|nr:hypothetical protein EBN03_06575 [Nocardia stercoris]
MARGCGAAYLLGRRCSEGLAGADYESIATRRYRDGRTEAMRVVVAMPPEHSPAGHPRPPGRVGFGP